MHTRCYKFSSIILVAVVMFFLSGMTCNAEEVYQNTITGYSVVVDDEAGLLTETKRAEMIEVMKEITTYGNVAFASGQKADGDWQTEELAKQYYKEYFGNTTGTIFYIDMKSRYLYIYSHNEMHRIITSNYANTITDNVYRYAASGAYGDCAIETYEQILKLLHGQRIRQPMKYISNTLLGIVIGFLLTFLAVLRWYKEHIPSIEDKEGMIRKNINYVNINVVGETRERIFYPQGNPNRCYSDSGIDNGGGGSFSGGDFGGGDSGGGDSGSGGGGGHSF